MFVVSTGIQGELKFVLGQLLSETLKINLGEASVSLASEQTKMTYATLNLADLVLEQNQPMSKPIQVDLQIPGNPAIQKDLNTYFDSLELTFALTGFTAGSGNRKLNLFSKVRIPFKKLFQGDSTLDWDKIIKFDKPVPRPFHFAVELPFTFYPELDLQFGSVDCDFHIRETKVATVTIDDLVAKPGKNAINMRASVRWFSALWKLFREIFSSWPPAKNVIRDLTISEINAASVDHKNIAWFTDSLKGYIIPVGKMITMMTENSYDVFTDAPLELNDTGEL